MSKKITDYLRYITIEQAFDWCGDWTAAILHDEFHKKQPRIGGDETDYRERGIERLIKIGVPWGSNGNIDYLIVKKYMRVVCPYCGQEMTFNGVTGRMYVCGCGAVANPTGSLNFSPPKSDA